MSELSDRELGMKRNITRRDLLSLWNKFVLGGGETPCEGVRKTFGRIAIANCDAGARALHGWGD